MEEQELTQEHVDAEYARIVALIEIEELGKLVGELEVANK